MTGRAFFSTASDELLRQTAERLIAESGRPLDPKLKVALEEFLALAPRCIEALGTLKDATPDCASKDVVKVIDGTIGGLMSTLRFYEDLRQGVIC
jgi:hypothetical protein